MTDPFLMEFYRLQLLINWKGYLWWNLGKEFNSIQPKGVAEQLPWWNSLLNPAGRKISTLRWTKSPTSQIQFNYKYIKIDPILQNNVERFIKLLFSFFYKNFFQLAARALWSGAHLLPLFSCTPTNFNKIKFSFVSEFSCTDFFINMLRGENWGREIGLQAFALPKQPIKIKLI